MRKDQAYQLYEDTNKSDDAIMRQRMTTQNRLQALDQQRLVDQQRIMQTEHIRKVVDIDRELDPLRFIDFPNLRLGMRRK